MAKLAQNLGFWRSLGVPRLQPQKGRLPIQDRYVSSCKISRRSVSPSPIYLWLNIKYKKLCCRKEAKRPRDASCLYSFYTLEWCGYPMVKKIRTYVYSFWHDPRTWKNRRFHVQQPTFLFLLETPLRLSCNVLHGSKDNSMLAKQLAVCTYLSSIVSDLCLSQCVSPKIAIFTTLV